jgi:ABC-type hemin transport system substrate-binding protein
VVEKMSNAPEPGFAPQRVVSLAPFLTDSMIALGFGRFLAGVTDSCPLLPSLVAVPRVGAPEDLRAESIIDLKPELILASSEANPPALIEALSKSNLRIWVSDPRTVRQAVSDIRDLAMMYAAESALQSVVWLDRSLDWLEGSRSEKRVRVFCPRSREGWTAHPTSWVTIGSDTYTGDLLSLCGAENVFAGRNDRRYPAVTTEEIMAAEPEVILLPGEPFPFSEEDVSNLRKMMPDVPAIHSGRIPLIDGRLLFWPGTRVGEAIRILPELLSAKE